MLGLVKAGEARSGAQLTTVDFTDAVVDLSHDQLMEN
jgi:hypothetical protein